MATTNQSLHSTVLKRHLEWLKTSIWLIPTLLSFLAIALAVVALSIDRNFGDLAIASPDFGMDVEATRNLMGVLASAFVSVGGISFSVTMVALTLTSGQYGPKVLRHFLENTRNKVSLGLFFGTAVYALAVSISLHPGDKARLSVFLALALAMAALIEFIGFIHRTAIDLQADQLIQRLGKQLRQDMCRLCDNEDMPERESTTLSFRKATSGMSKETLYAVDEGYIQTVDYTGLVDELRRYKALAILRARPGDFVIPGSDLLYVWSEGGIDLADAGAPLRNQITTGPLRTPIQDPEFPITQIQQIAARALSTGINDPGTAITCIDWLTLALSEVVDADLPGSVVLGPDKEPRLLLRPVDFAYLVKLVYAPMRQSSSDDLQVSLRLMQSLIRLAALTQRRDRLSLLRAEGERIWAQIDSAVHASHDLLPIKQSLQRLRAGTNEAASKISA
ncbi:DUF2254 domain-containing protein [Congregibacter litoralis]|uniref:Putative membrane protein n=1 Tax=Congregibacter litoralis KT71 TaxID=314285 RepID=A4ACE6_9GAMM|nr:DUF2254 domain-containing protein [Congregibacter litoralis]EAQ96374.2 putative membrane protein [Congregibacter litoralis KT71]